MIKNRAPGPDGMSIEFCQSYYNDIKNDIMQD
jgi:hypothetical protein